VTEANWDQMKRRHLPLVLCSLLLTVAAAWSQPMIGTVYGVYPEGVMVQQPGGAVLVPTQHASFEMGGVRLNYSQLLPGQAISVMVPQPYLPQVLHIDDPYAWKCRYHPQHPHGGPPGQMKKGYGGKGKGKGR